MSNERYRVSFRFPVGDGTFRHGSINGELVDRDVALNLANTLRDAGAKVFVTELSEKPIQLPERPR